MTSILEVKKAVEPALLEDDDVMGIGLSPERDAIIIYAKVPMVFETGRIGGYPVRVAHVTPMSVQWFERNKIRPVVGGISAGDYLHRETGTLGMVVYDRESGRPLLMSNNHVFGNADAIIQPGEVDGGGANEKVGKLFRAIPWKVLPDVNIVDVALASVDGEYIDGILSERFVIVPHGTKTVRKGVNVYKVGRTTGKTIGKIIDTDFTVDVVTGEESDGTPIYTRFVDQLLIDMESKPGDSGSIIMDMSDRAVGLLFAGGYSKGDKSLVVANKIRNVLALADVELTQIQH